MQFPLSRKASKTSTNEIMKLYEWARTLVQGSEFSGEVTWQSSRDFINFTETDFLREAGWVILCSGFKEQVVRRKFSYISLCFCDWEAAELIVEQKEMCARSALSAINNHAKINAIIKVAEQICRNGFSVVKRNIIATPIETLKTFPYIGDITVWHLAKNLGLAVAKPDRHLVRLAHKTGYESAHSLCSDIASLTGDPIQVVDLILWRTTTLFLNSMPMAIAKPLQHIA